MASVTPEIAGLEGFSGELLAPGDAGYEDARRVHNGLIDKRPALIARCLATADVVAAVGYARDKGLEISVRGGGHNVAGRAVTDGGVMIDLSLMKGIQVDPEGRTARAQGGVIWAELNRETQQHGLAVTGGAISSTGVAGLTLGGGLGWLMPKLGLAADNLLSAEVVTADGRIVRASETENADLFWGLRGGGGNFGVVTWFEFRLHQVGPIVTGGLIAYPVEAGGEVLRFFRDFSAGASDELMLMGALAHAPDGSGMKISGIAVCHVGTPEQAEADLAPLRAFGDPAMAMLGPMPYSAVNQMLDGGFPKGGLSYWKSTFLTELSDAAIDTIVSHFVVTPSPMNGVILEHFHGAVCRVPADATPVPHRAPGYNVVLPSVWLDPAQTDANIAWTRETFDALEPFRDRRRWMNYLADDESGQGDLREAYGANYDRLAALKAKYDPGNLFRLNHNIAPAA